jgi:hypothetical protein
VSIGNYVLHAISLGIFIVMVMMTFNIYLLAALCGVSILFSLWAQVQQNKFETNLTGIVPSYQPSFEAGGLIIKRHHQNGLFKQYFFTVETPLQNVIMAHVVEIPNTFTKPLSPDEAV